MARSGLTDDAVLVVRVPFMPPTLYYRAYAEPLDDGSILDWLVSWYVGSAPPRCRLAFVAANGHERGRLLAAQTRPVELLILESTGESEMHFCRWLMDTLRTTRLVVSSFTHCVAPTSLIRDTLRIHKATKAQLSDVRAPSFGSPLYAIDEAMVERLLASSTPGSSRRLLEAADTLFNSPDKARRPEGESGWQRLNGPLLLGINAQRWPEVVSIESARDAAILRHAVELRSDDAPRNRAFLDLWKQAASAVRALEPTQSDRPSRRLPRSSPPTGRIRVLHVSTVSHFVGAAESLCHLIDGLDPQRVESVAAISFEGVFTDALRKRGVTVISPNTDLKALDLDAIRTARDLIETAAPDIVHANHTLALPLLSAIAHARVPLIQHVRLDCPEEFRQEAHAADWVVCVSEFIRAGVLGLDVDPDRVSVILDGIDTTHFRPDPTQKGPTRARLGIPADEFVVAVVARMERQKRIETVVRAVGHMRRAISRGYLLLITPRGADHQYEEEVIRLVHQEGLASYAQRFDFVTDVPSMLHACDSLALMSFKEAMPRVAVEGMAMGLAVVVGDSGGGREVIDPGRTGLIVPYADAPGLGTLLTELARDPARVERIGAAAVESVQTKWTDRQCAQDVERLYDTILARSGRYQPGFTL